MKNKLFFSLSLLILMVSVIINYKFNLSLKEQSVLVLEFNDSASLNAPIEMVENFEDSFPNLTVTTVPISMFKSRYFIKAKRFDEALQLLYKAKSENPYLGIVDFELAKHYYGRNIDSSYYYAKMAHNKLPRNDYHSKIYFSVLAKKQKEKELDSAFNKIKMYKSFEQLKDYIFSKLELNSSNREKLKELLKNPREYVANRDQFTTLQTLVNIGYESMEDTQAKILKAEVLFDQNKLIESAVIYDEISNSDPTQYLLKENAGIAYFKASMSKASENSFRYIINNFYDRKDSKSEFYLGLVYLEKGLKKEGCFYLNVARENSFPGSRNYWEQFCN